MLEEDMIVNGEPEVLKRIKAVGLLLVLPVLILIFVCMAIPIALYAMTGAIVLAFGVAGLLALLWAILTVLRRLVPSFTVTMKSLLDRGVAVFVDIKQYLDSRER